MYHVAYRPQSPLKKEKKTWEYPEESDRTLRNQQIAHAESDW